MLVDRALVAVGLVFAVSIVAPVAWAEPPPGLSARGSAAPIAPQKIDPREIRLREVVIKFHDGAGIRIEQAKLTAAADPDLRTDEAKDRARLFASGFSASSVEASIERVQRLLDNLHLLPAHLFGVAASACPLLDRTLIQQRNVSRTVPDRRMFVTVPAPGLSKPAIARLIDALNAEPIVEIAYPAPLPVPAGIDLPPPTGSWDGYQFHLRAAAAGGIDADFAHGVDGGGGEHVTIADVEYAWILDHEDVPPVVFDKGSPPLGARLRHHGTAVLGVLGAPDEISTRFGVIGIAHHATFGVSSVRNRADPQSAPSLSTARAILQAACELKRGDVLLVETQAPGPDPHIECPAGCFCPQFGSVPAEYTRAEFAVIQDVTDVGIVVVEAAGNGCVDLDHPRYGGAFDRTIRDSSAILVGAGNPMRHGPSVFSNAGTRVDLQGWGTDVTTTGIGGLPPLGGNDLRQWYTRRFNGTSAASAIVAGAAGVLQSRRLELQLPPLTSAAMARALADTGTPQQPGRIVGPLPNLRAAFDALAQAATITPPEGDDSGG